MTFALRSDQRTGSGVISLSQLLGPTLGNFDLLCRVRHDFPSESILHKSCIRPCVEYSGQIYCGPSTIFLKFLKKIKRNIYRYLIDPDQTFRVKQLSPRCNMVSLCQALNSKQFESFFKLIKHSFYPMDLSINYELSEIYIYLCMYQGRSKTYKSHP